ncbi:phosphoribosylaminoimidazolesuccinocarboxamide synthase [Candidatus Uhrbacteria bacterium]|nr:phosphoribosylaminoimidazolesuccinocarboxamide synthase [Candidatus Uhrbacteria bacterium]
MIDRARIQQNLNNCLTQTDIPSLGPVKHGKVRDVYERGNELILIATDRQSAFDRILAAIPFKGQVLNQVSQFWFENTRHIIRNHAVRYPDPNVIIAKKCTVFPVEFVVRGYLTGVTGTSVWTAYQKGSREFCGNLLPDGMRKNQPFATPIITPSTKSDEHDENVTPAQIIERALMSKEDWYYTSQKALELFAHGQKVAREHGMILVDTKYEMGKDADGNILLIDEVHTPDSSRYWIAESFQQRIAEGKEPENIDKEFLRLWFKDHCDPYNDKELPKAPDELVVELSARYIQLYEAITGQQFEYPDGSNIQERIQKNITKV